MGARHADDLARRRLDQRFVFARVPRLRVRVNVWRVNGRGDDMRGIALFLSLRGVNCICRGATR